MSKAFETIYLCPERRSATCLKQRGICERERLAHMGERDALGKIASESVMNIFQELETRCANWGNQTAVNTLREVFKSVAQKKYDEINPSTAILCTGPTLLRNACTAEILPA